MARGCESLELEVGHGHGAPKRRGEAWKFRRTLTYWIAIMLLSKLHFQMDRWCVSIFPRAMDGANGNGCMDGKPIVRDIANQDCYCR